MTVEVINTGSELLLGQVLNTHLGYFAEQLLPLGVGVARAQVVPDGPDIERAAREAAARADIVLVTGGLGPTSDDLTRDLVADLCAAPLEFRPEVWEKIRARFARRGVEPSELSRVQAFVPRGATVLPNDYGTAPGFYLRKDRAHLFCLPGPPRELVPMFAASALPLLRQILAGTPPVTRKILRVYGIGESFVQERVERTVREAVGVRVEIGYCARLGEVDLRLISPDAKAVVAAADIVRLLLGDAVYAEDEVTMEQTVIAAARAAGKTITVAESCTGGLVANLLTNVPGASVVFPRGWVVYSDSAKIDELGVHPETVKKHGAVSEQCAGEMALGALTRAGTDFAVALTGIAGPDGGTPENPVGTLYAAFARRGAAVKVYRKHLPFERPVFKQAAAQFALNLSRLAIT